MILLTQVNGKTGIVLDSIAIEGRPSMRIQTARNMVDVFPYQKVTKMIVGKFSRDIPPEQIWDTVFENDRKR